MQMKFRDFKMWNYIKKEISRKLRSKNGFDPGADNNTQSAEPVQRGAPCRAPTSALIASLFWAQSIDTQLWIFKLT